jgi:hypothetical protein
MNSATEGRFPNSGSAVRGEANGSHDDPAVIRGLLGLGPGGRTFSCPQCRRIDDVTEALAAKMFVATQILGLDVDRAVGLGAVDVSQARELAWRWGLWTSDEYRNRIIGLVQLAASPPRCHACTLRLANLFLGEQRRTTITVEKPRRLGPHRCRG